ncbi:hypothetical protein [Sphingobium sp.]|uniref:hypothetical protein n=1 Tax=Sphingobium sp. TaxID=1912891 RepID=UPI00257C61C4|nr:hypothetical protein [Sphingobium sp.]
MSVLLATSTVGASGGGASYPTTGAFFLTMGVIVSLCIIAILLAFALRRNAGVAAD